jgi:hypothetical protein
MNCRQLIETMTEKGYWQLSKPRVPMKVGHGQFAFYLL